MTEFVSSGPSSGARGKLLTWLLPAAVILVAAIFPLVVDRPRFWVPSIGIRSLWLGLIAMSLVFLNRYVGLLSLAQVTIAGISAYGVGYVTVTLGQPVLVAVPVGIAAGTLAGFLVALIAVRTRAIYFLMITLALSQVFYSWASQAVEITNARRGLSPIHRPDVGIDLGNYVNFYYVALVVVILCFYLARFVGNTSFGLALQGIRESPERMRALGYHVNRYRVAAVTFAAFIASIGGVLLVLERAQVDPDVVSLSSTLNVLVVAVIGGIGSLGGVFIGAILFTLLDNFAQDFTERYMTLTGLVFIAVLLFAPAGLAGVGTQVKGLIERKLPHRKQGQAEARSEEAPTETSAGVAITKGNSNEAG